MLSQRGFLSCFHVFYPACFYVVFVYPDLLLTSICLVVLPALLFL